MNVTVRPSHISDADTVHRLLCIIADIHRNGREDIFKGLQSKYTLEQVKERLSKQDNGVFVADSNGSVAGYIFCDIITEGDGKTLYIDDLCVDPAFRKLGIGNALMDYAVSYGKEQDCRMLMLNVWEFNENAVRFYENYGLTTRSRHMEIKI